MELKPEDVAKMMQGHIVAGILKSAITLGVFDQIAAGNDSAESAAKGIGASPRGTKVLLDALASLGIIVQDGVKYRLTPVAENHLVRGSPAFFGDTARIFASDYQWERMKSFSDAVKKGGTVFKDDADTPDHPFWHDFAKFSYGMAGPAAAALAGILDIWCAGQDSLDILDVACGTGLYGYTVAMHHPHARVWSLDWPGVLKISRGYAEKMGIIDRVKFIEGNLFEAPLGGPYDLVTASHIFHHFSEETCAGLMKRLSGAVKKGGKIAIHEFSSAGGGLPHDQFPPIFAVIMLAWTREGNAYPLSNYEKWLADAGFGKPSIYENPTSPTRFIIAEKKSQ